MFTLDAEVRCDYLISEEMKKLWSVQMGCMAELRRICEKYNIRFFAGGGTLLGAVRHKGYIPWDDDMDFFMLREDYVRFCEIAPQEIQGPYYFQHFSTQKSIGLGFCRIRNSQTTACTKWELENFAQKEDYNCGVFIDIFPLVYVPEGKMKIRWYKLKTQFYQKALLGHIVAQRLKDNGKYTWKARFKPSILLWNLVRIFMRPETFFQRGFNAYDMYKSGKRVGLIPFMGYCEKYFWDKEYFAESIELPFEDITVPCPKEYDKVLRHQYGDYMVWEKGTALHTYAVLDPDTPYKTKLQAQYDKNKIQNKAVGR